MPPVKVKVSDLITASGSYVADRLKKADANKNGHLTRVEAKSLPTDLRDNFDHYVKKTGAKNVAVEDFAKSFQAYVAATAKKADKNHDGYLTYTDSKNLPQDLQDNFWNYYRATKTEGTTGPTTGSVQDLGRKALANYVNDVLFNPQNADGKSFRDACLDGTTTGARAKQVKAEMLAEAAKWAPDAADWEMSGQQPNQTYAGRFWGLYTEIRFKSGKPDSVYVEID